MQNKARDLQAQYKDVIKQAKLLLSNAVEAGDLKQALLVFLGVEEILPTTTWYPNEEAYPLIRVHLESYDHFNRGGVYSFSELFEEEIWYFTEANEAVIADIKSKGQWNPDESAETLWEIIRNGNSKFTFDW